MIMNSFALGLIIGIGIGLFVGFWVDLYRKREREQKIKTYKKDKNIIEIYEID